MERFFSDKKLSSHKTLSCHKTSSCYTTLSCHKSWRSEFCVQILNQSNPESGLWQSLTGFFQGLEFEMFFQGLEFEMVLAESCYARCSWHYVIVHYFWMPLHEQRWITKDEVSPHREPAWYGMVWNYTPPRTWYGMVWNHTIPRACMVWYGMEPYHTESMHVQYGMELYPTESMHGDRRVRQKPARLQ